MAYEDWYYLINLGGGEIVQCPGNGLRATEHLRQICMDHVVEHKARTGREPDSVPWLIGVYPPNTVGGPDGKGGVYSYGYKPTLLGHINTPRDEWQRI